MRKGAEARTLETPSSVSKEQGENPILTLFVADENSDEDRETVPSQGSGPKRMADVSRSACYVCKKLTGLQCDFYERPICGDHSVPFAHEINPEGERVSRICVSCDLADRAETNHGQLDKRDKLKSCNVIISKISS